MNRMFPALAGVAAVALVALVAVGLYFNQPRGMGGVPPTRTQAPSPSAAPSPTAEPSPTATAAATSTPVAFVPYPLAVTQPLDGAPGITVTIPAPGWRDEDIALVKGGEAKNVPEAAILLWPYPAGKKFYVYGDPCQWTSTKPDKPATTVDEIVAGLAAQASRDASEPVDVMIGGYAGKSITLHVPDDAVFDDCDQGKFASYEVEGLEPPDRYHQGPGQIDQFWFLDVDGAIVMIDAMYRPDTSPELVEEMRTIVESATFETL